MRFNKIEKFNIDELSLDQGNYRFHAAENQRACVQKIYNINPAYFKGIMKSVAEEDLGEPILVFLDKGKNIVADGNRRIAALKVLRDDAYAPTESIKDYAAELRKENKISFKGIQAQVSDDRSLIARTVYERHSGGKNGTSRIPWSAYAAARFGFDKHVGDHKEWYIMALLTRTEEEKPSIQSFVNSSDFSYEVFRRIVRRAIKKGIISEDIFSSRGERIKKGAPKQLVDDAIKKSYKFLISMKNRDISLARGENFADATAVDKYLDDFSLSPDNQKKEDAKSNGQDADDVAETDYTDDAELKDNSDDTGNDQDGEEIENRKVGRGINKSDLIEKKLDQLGSTKLKSLYKSLCNVALNTNPQLMYVGAWSFFESLASLAGKTINSDFVSFFKGEMKNTGIEKGALKDCWLSLKDISDRGDANKHSGRYETRNAEQLRVDFDVLEPLILEILDGLIKKKKKAA